MSTVVAEVQVREGLIKLQTRLDVRVNGAYSTFAERDLLARTFATGHTPLGYAPLLDVPAIRWTMLPDFLPGFTMALEWYAEKITPNPTNP